MKYTDQLQRTLEIPENPKRIISLVPSQTELLVDLGLIDSIVGITKFCVHPQDLRKEIEVVGGTKQVKLEKIKSLQPDLILCNKEENTEEMVRNLEQVAPVHVSDIYTIADSFTLIRQYGELFAVQEKSEDLVRNIEQEFKSFRNFIQTQPKRKVVYFIWRKPWMIAGGKTFINTLLHANQFENVYEDIARYPEVKLEDLRDVDCVLLSSEPFPFQEKHAEELSAYVPREKIKFVDGEFFSWYGSRLEKAFRYFKKWQETEFSSE